MNSHPKAIMPTIIRGQTSNSSSTGIPIAHSIRLLLSGPPGVCFAFSPVRYLVQLHELADHLGLAAVAGGVFHGDRLSHNPYPLGGGLCEPRIAVRVRACQVTGITPRRQSPYSSFDRLRMSGPDGRLSHACFASGWSGTTL